MAREGRGWRGRMGRMAWAGCGASGRPQARHKLGRVTDRELPRIAVLGPVRVPGRDGLPVEPPGAMGKRLLVALALDGGSLSAGALIDELWPDAELQNARAALQTLVSRVRAVAAAGLIASTASGYAIDSSVADLDLAAARRACDDAGHADPGRAFEIATDALALWRGEPGADLGEGELAERLASSAGALHDDLQSCRVRACLDLGRTDAALVGAQQLADAHPGDEGATLLLMRALAASGRRNDALRVFAQLRERLAEELGTGPGPDLVGFNGQLLAEEDSAAGASTRIGVRASATPLLGREKDVAELTALLRAQRLVTILGAGGLGKTRLAHELAARATQPAVVVVELAAVAHGDDVALVLASTLGIGDMTGSRLGRDLPVVAPDLKTSIVRALAERPTLLIVDNCEHVVDSAAEWIADLLAAAASLTVLTTSRAPLLLAAEHVYPLQPLPATSETGLGPAARLFMERARSARPDVALPEPAIIRLCQSLDGLPLAIELAAARVRSMDVAEIERRLDHRFALLTGGERAAPQRHRTLLAVIDWSWNLLDDDERRLLRRLARFPDGFSARAAEAMMPDRDPLAARDTLESLVNQSLVAVVEPGGVARPGADDAARREERPRDDAQPGGPGGLRYRMLETVREFGVMALVDAGDDAEADRMMAVWAVDLCLWALARIHGPDQLRAMRVLTLEQENLIAVLRNALAGLRPEIVAPVYAALGHRWTLLGEHLEGAGFAPMAAEALRHYQPSPELADATILALVEVSFTGMVSERRAAAVARSALRRLTARPEVLDPTLRFIAEAVLVAPRIESLPEVIARRELDPFTTAVARLLQSQVAENEADIASALDLCREAWDAARQAEDAWLMGTAAKSLAHLNSQSGAWRAALEWADRAREHLVALGAGNDLHQLDWLVALARIRSGETEESAAAFAALAALAPGGWFEAEELPAVGAAGLAEVEVARGNLAAALRLYQSALQAFPRPAMRNSPWFAIIASAWVSLAAMAGEPDSAPVRTVVRELRLYLRVVGRVRGPGADKPVMGSALVGPAVWFSVVGQARADSAMAGAGLELFALARRMGARQDIPSMDLGRLRSRLAQTYGEDAVARAEQAAAGMGTQDARVQRALAVLAERALRV